MNASPLIFLSRVALLDLLLEPGVDVIVPDVVAREIAARGPDDPTIQAINGAAWLQVAPSPNTPASVLAWNLGPGESAVLSMALANPGDHEVVLDDRAARRCARAMTLPFQGTLSLVLLAKDLGRIPKARPVLEQLRRSGMYLSDRVLEMALNQVGESLSN